MNGQGIGEFEVWDTIHVHSYNEELINEHGIQNPMGGVPTNWKPLSGFGVTRTTDSYTDDFALILHNWYHYANEQIIYKDELNEFPISISGYYKYIRDTEQPDSLLGIGELRVLNQDKVAIGIANFEFDTCTNYKYFEFPISQFSNEQPDSIEIIFKNSNSFSACFSPVCNFLYLDNIAINYTSSTIENLADEFNIYPNPTTGKLILENDYQQNFVIAILDMYGNLIKTILSNGRINIEELNSGLYILQIFNENKIESMKVLKL